MHWPTRLAGLAVISLAACSSSEPDEGGAADAGRDGTVGVSAPDGSRDGPASTSSDASVSPDAGSAPDAAVVTDSGSAADASTCPPMQAGDPTMSTNCFPGTPDENALSCPANCGPSYSYVCQGGNPSISGCTRSPGDGGVESYCCPTEACTRYSVLDGICGGATPGNAWACPTGTPQVTPPRTGCSAPTINETGFVAYCCPP